MDPLCLIQLVTCLAQEVAKILQEGQSDIISDPVLHEACALDMQKHCSSVPEGHGRSKWSRASHA